MPNLFGGYNMKACETAGCWCCANATRREWTGDKYVYYCSKKLLSPVNKKKGLDCRHFSCVYRISKPHGICQQCTGCR